MDLLLTAYGSPRGTTIATFDSPEALSAFGLLFIAVALWGLLAGEYSYRRNIFGDSLGLNDRIRRADNPLGFWIVFIGFFGFGLSLVLARFF